MKGNVTFDQVNLVSRITGEGVGRYISFFFLVGPGPVHEIDVLAFSSSPLGRADTFSFQYLQSTPRISLSASPFYLISQR